MNIVCIGAHPDDAEVFAGGVMMMGARAGHWVAAVSLTNGDIGHHEQAGGVLAQRRLEEARRAAAIGGYESLVLDHHDGELINDLALRKQVTGLIRDYQADVVFTHRPNDYHPDHRYAALAVQDAAFMVTVPFFCPDKPALRANPVFLHLFDPFEYPVPFRPDLVVDVTPVMEDKWRLLDAMPSQFYEWLPWIEGASECAPPVEAGEAARRAWLERYYGPMLALPAERHRKAVLEQYGADGAAIRFIEAFQLCELGRCPDRAMLQGMFRFSQENRICP